jgi:2-polyprenyl-3-methyl-5-hydroxy-6-metoxy-1,4-benzoquinol methylase
MLSGVDSVIEIGCGDGFGAQFVIQEVNRVHAIDIDPNFIAWAKDHVKRESQSATYEVLDILQRPPTGTFDAAFSLDVIEHISAASESEFMSNLCGSLNEHGICIIGTPNEAASAYASAGSIEGHVNLKSAESLRELMSEYFYNVFIFSMNDEVVHTGYHPMAHYLFAIGSDRRLH